MGDLHHEEEVKKLYAIINSMSKRLEAVEGSRKLIGPQYDSSNEPFSSGDTAWMLAATALVLLMTLPGLSLYYAGMASRRQNVMTTAMQAFSTAGLVTLMWMFFGYSLTFETGSPVIGSQRRFWLVNLDLEKGHPRAPTIPEPLHCAFQLAFAIMTACLMLGASADRMKYSSMLVFVCLWHLLVYCPIAHAHWSDDGFLYKAGVLDYAGGNVVHISAGVSGMASSIVLGKRYGLGVKKFAPHNILYTIIGACLLWVGWYGFNAGSAYGANVQAAMAMLTTQISTSAASFSWMMMDYFMSRQITVLGLLSGAIAGLVSITPAAGYVDSTGAFFIGLLAGPVCYMGVRLKQRMGFDDALDAFGLHGIAGAYGGFMTGLFATNFGTQGAFYGDSGLQLGLQLYGIVVSAGYAFFMTLVILIFIDIVLGVRLSLMAERFGLDRSVHGEGLYAERPADKTPQQHVADLLRSYAEVSNQPVAQFLVRYQQGHEDEAISSLTGGEENNFKGANGGVTRINTQANAASVVSDDRKHLPLTAAFLKMFSPPVDGYRSRLESVGLKPFGVEGGGEAYDEQGEQLPPQDADAYGDDDQERKLVGSKGGGVVIDAAAGDNDLGGQRKSVKFALSVEVEEEIVASGGVVPVPEVVGQQPRPPGAKQQSSNSQLQSQSQSGRCSPGEEVVLEIDSRLATAAAVAGTAVAGTDGSVYSTANRISGVNGHQYSASADGDVESGGAAYK